MAEMIENPGAQEFVQENQTAVEQPKGEGGENKNKGDIRQETEYGYETELDYMDSSIPEDDDDSTLKEQDISDDEDDDERDLEEKCASKMQEMQISNEENEQEIHISQQEPQGGRKLRERKTKPGDYKKTHAGKQDTTTKQTKDTAQRRKTSTRTPKAEKSNENETPAGHQGSTAEETPETNPNANKELQKLREQINKIKRTSKEKEMENTRLNKIIQERDQEIQTLKQNLADKEKELTETKEKLLQILLKERENRNTETENVENEPAEEIEKPTLIIVGDSNTGRMLPDIKTTLNKWNTIRSTTMTSEDTKFWATQEQEEALNGNTVIIHVGTNDIRHGRKARTILENIKKAVTTVEEKGAKCLIMQIPPMYTNSEDAREVVKLNAMLEGTHDTQLINNTAIEHDRKMIVDDGYHLSKEGTAACAREIARHLTQTTPPQERNVSVQDQTCIIEIPNTPPNPDENHTETIETTAEIAGRVIGQGASTIKRIKAKYQVQITTIKEGNKRKFQIEGHRQNTQKARQDISRIISETARRDRNKVQEETRPPKYRTVCRYYRNGYCRMGKQCQFLHSQEHPMEVSPRTPRGPERGTQREDSRQWNPRPSTSQEHRQDEESWPRLQASQERKRKRSQENEGDSDHEQEMMRKIMALVKEIKKK